jgi:hypothetical protein
MRKIREVLRLKWIAGSSARQIAKSCNIARSTVKEYLIRAEEAGLTWPKACKLDDTDLGPALPPKPLNDPFPASDALYGLSSPRDAQKKRHSSAPVV